MQRLLEQNAQAALERLLLPAGGLVVASCLWQYLISQLRRAAAAGANVQALFVVGALALCRQVGCCVMFMVCGSSCFAAWAAAAAGADMQAALERLLLIKWVGLWCRSPDSKRCRGVSGCYSCPVCPGEGLRSA
jgi:hypothetical protein